MTIRKAPAEARPDRGRVDIEDGQVGSESELGKLADLFELPRERIDDEVLIEEAAVVASPHLSDVTAAVLVPPPLAEPREPAGVGVTRPQLRLLRPGRH